MKVFKGVCLAVIVFFGLIFFVGIVTGLDLEDVSQEKADKNSYKLVKEYYKLSRSSGYLYVNYFRIIENTGDTNLYLDYSEFEISNTSGTILDQTSTFGAPQVIRPGEKGVYQCMFSFRHSEFTPESYNFVVKADLDIQKTKKSVIKLKTSNVSVKETDSNNIIIRGNVSNNTDKNLKNFQIVAFLYNEFDEMIGVAKNIYSNLDSGRNMNFDFSHYMMKNNIDSWDVKRYEIIAIAVE